MRVTIALLCAAFACGGDKPVSAPHVVASAAPSASATCTDAPRAADAYEPEPAWSGRAANIPDPPVLPTTPRRIGDAYTVYGAIHALSSLAEAHDVTAREITIVGYVVDTNLARAPKCALHKTGRADPDGCVSEIPTFTIADDKAAAAGAPRIRVMGWASNFANVFDAYTKERAHDTTPTTDEIWATEIPSPLPAVGATVKITGHYGVMMTKASSGLVSDPRNGILTPAHTETLERATQPAQLGVR